MTLKIGTTRLRKFATDKMHGHFQAGLEKAEQLQTGIIIWIQDLQEKDFRRIREDRDLDGVFRKNGNSVFLEEIVQKLDLKNSVFSEYELRKYYWKRAQILDKMYTVIIAHFHAELDAFTRYYRGRNVLGRHIPHIPLASKMGVYTRVRTHTWIEKEDANYEDITHLVKCQYGIINYSNYTIYDHI